MESLQYTSLAQMFFANCDREDFAGWFHRRPGGWEHFSGTRLRNETQFLALALRSRGLSAGESIGIDLGVKDLAIVSTGKVYKNINKTPKVKRLKKRLKKEQRIVSRKIEGNIESRDSKRRPTWKRPLKECKNIQRQNQKIRLIHKKLADIRNNHLHQTTSEIVKTKPSRIVMENLNVSGMMKNRHLSKAIAEQKFYEFKRQIKYKCEQYDIEFVEVDRFYASSKTCSHCGHIKIDLKLSDRIYECAECGLTIDRDLNAAINLANYQI